jgi:hypothetical protein
MYGQTFMHAIVICTDLLILLRSSLSHSLRPTLIQIFASTFAIGYALQHFEIMQMTHRVSQCIVKRCARRRRYNLT